MQIRLSSSKGQHDLCEIGDSRTPQQIHARQQALDDTRTIGKEFHGNAIPRHDTGTLARFLELTAQLGGYQPL